MRKLHGGAFKEICQALHHFADIRQIDSSVAKVEWPGFLIFFGLCCRVNHDAWKGRLAAEVRRRTGGRSRGHAGGAARHAGVRERNGISQRSAPRQPSGRNHWGKCSPLNADRSSGGGPVEALQPRKSLCRRPPTSALAAFGAREPPVCFCLSEQAPIAVAAVGILAELARTIRRHRTGLQR
jgi:hypothetical protein